MPHDSKTSERKLTEDLLAGFDRTGRTPKMPPAAKDFVEFHRKPLERPPSPPRKAEPTFVVRPRRGVPAWLPWAGVVLVMMIGGATVAWLVRPPTPTPAVPAAKSAPQTPPGVVRRR